ncbi:MAG: hypothetical protein Q9209_001539 [Squamulea sp. 1 TL-2023]
MRRQEPNFADRLMQTDADHMAGIENLMDPYNNIQPDGTPHLSRPDSPVSDAASVDLEAERDESVLNLLPSIQFGQENPGFIAGSGAVILKGATHRRVTAMMDSNLSGFETPPYPSQQSGVANMLQCRKEDMKARILADEMGLGKSYQTILACLLDKEGRSGFDPIVTT